jgi:hypothetical protein
MAGEMPFLFIDKLFFTPTLNLKLVASEPPGTACPGFHRDDPHTC